MFIFIVAFKAAKVYMMKKKTFIMENLFLLFILATSLRKRPAINFCSLCSIICVKETPIQQLTNPSIILSKQLSTNEKGNFATYYVFYFNLSYSVSEYNSRKSLNR